MLRVALVSALLTISGVAAAEPPPSERQDQLLQLLKHDCGSCHGLTMKGGLGPPLLPGSLGGKGEDALVAIVLDGVPGTPMPPWRLELSDAEAAWLIRRLSSGVSP